MPGGDRGGLEVGVRRCGDHQGPGEFSGVGRRFQRYGEIAGGRSRHSPWSTTTAITRWKWRRPWPRRAAPFPAGAWCWPFQPHRYTRTRDCFEDFVKVLSQTDALLLAEVYAAGEAPVVAADGRSLARAVRVAGKVEPVFVADVNDLPQSLIDFVQDGDVVLTMGAGSVGQLPGKIVALADAVTPAGSAA
jgi:UDP-N-acetylmuramate--alanine ligase